MSKEAETPTIIISGASGFVGTVLVEHFAAKRWRVIGLVRHAAGREAPKNVHYVEFDLTQPVDDSIFAGADYFVHAAYIKASPKNPDAFEQNVAAAKQLVAAAHKHKVKKTLFMSSMSSHEEAVSVYGKQKLAIEKLFTTNRDIVLRSGLIIGNGGLVKQMAKFMASKRMVPLIGGGQQPLQIIGVYDLAQTIERALTSNLHGVFTTAHPTVHTYKSFYKALAKHLGIKVMFVPVPFNVLLALMRLIAVLPLPLSVSADNLLGLKKLRAVDTRDDLKKLGIDLCDLQAALERADLQL